MPEPLTNIAYRLLNYDYRSYLEVPRPDNGTSPELRPFKKDKPKQQVRNTRSSDISSSDRCSTQWKFVEISGTNPKQYYIQNVQTSTQYIGYYSNTSVISCATQNYAYKFTVTYDTVTDSYT